MRIEARCGGAKRDIARGIRLSRAKVEMRRQGMVQLR